MSYFTIKDEGMAEFEERKSVFIGYVKRVKTEEEAKEFIAKIKNMHKQATHNCSAYTVGENKGIQRYSDDGEPQGTAGIPILEVIKKNDLTDIAIVVTRYFGGILLGAGGLVRAYSKGASEAIKAGGIVEKVKGIEIKAQLDYDLLGKIQYICGKNQWHIEDTIYTDKVEIIMYCESKNYDVIHDSFVEATNGKVIISEEEEEYYFKMGNRLFKEEI
ncbi:MAG: YigZ family protein [Clostridium argentinense]|uniref:YigZ family protein n=1 Tax=Clostridium faecium TaxID=2762223 RepID=A0ABR8YWC1_9CLOT|nr:MULTISPECIES: YigZ family protein [Clostridium]MBD8048554.1 YigZ family protein [Clostridium faecium]MBS5822630.1 YigZ family protein [Clostridium argentinense]MDU1347805.1 YigZ family protein [Clostridium argentinense]